MNFNLSSETFVQNCDIDTIYKNITNLFNLVLEIKLFNDLVYKNNEVSSVDFFNGKKLWEVMYLDNTEFKQDYKTKLIEIVDRSKTLDNQEILALVGLNRIQTGNIIYSIQELLDFYYDYMKNVHDEEEFSILIKKYFKNLVFQEKIADTIKTLEGDGLRVFSRDILKSLIYLNDEFKDVLIKNSYDVRKSLIELSTSIGYETTIEGDADRKPAFTFEFLKDDKTKIDVCCEPHIKLSRSSKEGDTTYYYNRLYFHVGKDEIKQKCILIGSIGKHL